MKFQIQKIIDQETEEQIYIMETETDEHTSESETEGSENPY